MKGGATPAKDSISATQLAKLGLCEHQLSLDMHHGVAKATKEQTVFLDRGTKVHAKALRAAMAPAGRGSDRRCFIATAVYGADAWQTCELRAWRDRVLLRPAAGRIAVAIYYRWSPSLVTFVRKYPAVLPGIRRGIDRLVQYVGRKP